MHRLDAARLYRLVLEQATPGTRWHGVAEEGVPMRAIAGLLGERLGLPVRRISAEEAPAHFDWMARFVASSASTTRPRAPSRAKRWAGGPKGQTF
ncbi:MAG: hypothetical protein MUF34_34400 [Polyangiaceae bacterium]|nr:hypothetical protein [Polyangiaceae bacterium]